MNPTAPGLLVCCPSILCINSAIEWIYRPSGSSRPSWRRCRRRRGRRRWERRWWNCDRWGRQGCGRATPPHGHTTIVLLRLGPHRIVRAHWARDCAIVRLRSSATRQKPQKQWNQQQETQEAAARDDTGEISPWSYHIKITTEAYVLVGRLL